jgi:hypothetical protein
MIYYRCQIEISLSVCRASRTFAIKARSLYAKWSTCSCSSPIGSCRILNKLVRDKHASLFGPIVGDAQQKSLITLTLGIVVSAVPRHPQEQQQQQQQQQLQQQQLQQQHQQQHQRNQLLHQRLLQQHHHQQQQAFSLRTVSPSRLLQPVTSSSLTPVSGQTTLLPPPPATPSGLIITSNGGSTTVLPNQLPNSVFTATTTVNGSPGVSAIKTFVRVINEEALQVRTFAPGKLFEHSLIFAAKAGFYASVTDSCVPLWAYPQILD